MKAQSVKSGMARRAGFSLAAFLYMGAALVPMAHASDTEIYARDMTADNLVPTIMFMLDTSGSMAYCMQTDDSSGCGTRGGVRSQVLKDSMLKFLNGDSTEGIKPIPGYVRVGLSTYNTGGNGGRIRYSPRPLDALIELDPDGNMTTNASYGVSDAEQPPAGAMNNANTVLNVGFNGSTAQYVGLNFTEVLVPRGATINSAYLEFTAKNSDSAAATWQIMAENSDNSPDYASTAITATSRTYVADNAIVAPTAWTAESNYRFNVTNLVQKVVNRGARYYTTPPASAVNAGAWCGGNAMSFRIHDITGTGTPTRVAYSSDGAAAAGNMSKAPKLIISYSMGQEYFGDDATQWGTRWDSCTYKPFTISQPISNTWDDIYWTSSSSTVTYNSTTLPLAQVVTGSPNVPRASSVRFRSLALAKNSIINDATLYVTGSGTNSGVPDLAVSAYQSDNLPAFCTTNSNCTKPTATLSTSYRWQPPSATISSNVVYTVPPQSLATGGLKQMVQDIVNRTGWASGNSLGFQIQQFTTGTNNNAAVSSFDTGTPSKYPTLLIRGYSPTPVTDIRTLTTVRQQLVSGVNALTFTTSTPLGEAYVETAISMMGKTPSSDAQYDANTTGTDGKYVTPLVATTSCSGNYIFALTDGDPTSDDNISTNTTNAFGSGTCATSQPLGSSYATTWKCMAGVAKKLVNANGGIATKVKTSTVIMGPLGGDAEKGMKAVAADGGGKYYTATTSNDLVNAIQKTLDDLLDVSGTVSAPGVAVNQLSRLTHLDQLYYAVFNPRATDARWKGNLKRYRLDLVDGRIEDQNNAAAIDTGTTFFASGSSSFWSDNTVGPTNGTNKVDGDDALIGGAADELPSPDTRYGSTVRKMYSYYGTYPSTPVSSNTNLTQVAFNDTNLKTAMGLTDNTVFNNLTAWLLGYEVPDLADTATYNTSSDLRFQLGGAMHSRPVLVNYGYTGTLSAALLNPDNQDNTVYFSTMEGMLHGVDAKTGRELFSFIPKEMLANVRTLYNNISQTLPEFGLDSTWTVYRKDGDGDFKITSSSDRVILYGGMRMGGNNYYALDVTDRTAPKLLFTLVGGTSGALANMGQTWSEPVLASVKVNGVVKTVLVFGGGYDDKHEAAGYTTGTSDTDTKGNQVYIVDAFTGQIYWWASSAGSPPTSGQVAAMKFAIPSTVKTVDVNDDGLIDAVYVGDMGGQVFRLDIDNGNTSGNTLVKRVRLLASLGQTITSGTNTSNQRRFYEAPGVARFRNPGSNTPYYLVGIGSGYRSHPLDKNTQDMFYMLMDKDVVRSDILTVADTGLQATITGPTSAGTGGTLAALNTSSASGVTMTTTQQGWYVKFGTAGEKSLAAPLIFNGQVYFTSYLPDAAVDACSPVQGQTRLYRMAALDGALVDTNGDGSVTSADSRTTDNVMSGLGGAPLVVTAGNTLNGDGSTAVQRCPALPSNRHAYCDGVEVSVNDMACSVILTGTNVGGVEYQCLTGMKRTRWFNK